MQHMLRAYKTICSQHTFRWIGCKHMHRRGAYGLYDRLGAYGHIGCQHNKQQAARKAVCCHKSQWFIYNSASSTTNNTLRGRLRIAINLQTIAAKDNEKGEDKAERRRRKRWRRRRKEQEQEQEEAESFSDSWAFLVEISTDAFLTEGASIMLMVLWHSSSNCRHLATASLLWFLGSLLAFAAWVLDQVAAWVFVDAIYYLFF